jgi:hypothetical protein
MKAHNRLSNEDDNENDDNDTSNSSHMYNAKIQGNNKNQIKTRAKLRT